MLLFTVYVGLFNSFSSLLGQILTPYGFSESESGIAGAILIVTGLVSAAVVSPIIDRHKHYQWCVMVLVPLIGASYLGFFWAPSSGSVVAPYIICGLIGATSFCLLPIALEWLAEISWPVLPTLSSTVCWSGGQLLGAILIIASNSLEESQDASPPYNMRRGLILQTAIAMAAIPLVLVLPFLGIVNRRQLIEQRAA